jgi:hypothetical protein
MTVHPSPSNLAKGLVRRAAPKPEPRQPRERKAMSRGRDNGPSPKVREQVLARSQLCCERCGLWSPPPVGEIHHRRNKSQGPDNRLSNLVLVCKTCHAWVGQRPKEAHAEGFHLEHGDEPADTDLLYGGPKVAEYGRRQKFLCDDGSTSPAPSRGGVA